MASSQRIVYQQGDHVCTLYTTPEEQLVAAIEYIRGGLTRGERCLYVCCEHSPKAFRAALKQAGIPVEAEESRGSLLLLTKNDGHLKGGTFDPDRMISMLYTAVEDALAAGFTGLCAAGDMSWLLDNAPGSEKIAEYEAKLNQFYKSHSALGLCLYNRSTLPPAMLDHCLATHRYVRMDGSILLENPFYEPDEQAMTRTPRPHEVEAKILRLHSARRTS
jgi:hypothetical protein